MFKSTQKYTSQLSVPLLSPTTPINFKPQTKPGLLEWQPRLGLAEDSRATDFCLLLVLAGIGMTSSSQLRTYLTDWLSWQENLLRGYWNI